MTPIPTTRATASEPLVASFDSLEAATRAREALIADGVPAGRVELRVLHDESGPVEGNFLIGNGVTEHGGRPGAVLSGGEVPYDGNFRDTVYRGSVLLLVSEQDPALRAHIEKSFARLCASA